jgi:hypothetical protein
MTSLPNTGFIGSITQSRASPALYFEVMARSGQAPGIRPEHIERQGAAAAGEGAAFPAGFIFQLHQGLLEMVRSVDAKPVPTRKQPAVRSTTEN